MEHRHRTSSTSYSEARSRLPLASSSSVVHGCRLSAVFGRTAAPRHICTVLASFLRPKTFFNRSFPNFCNDYRVTFVSSLSHTLIAFVTYLLTYKVETCARRKRHTRCLEKTERSAYRNRHGDGIWQRILFIIIGHFAARSELWLMTTVNISFWRNKRILGLYVGHMTGSSMCSILKYIHSKKRYSRLYMNNYHSKTYCIGPS